MIYFVVLLISLIPNCLSGQINVQLKTGHTKSISEIALIKNESVAITASADKSMRFWDVKTGAIINQLNFNVELTSMVLSKDEKYAWVGGYNLSKEKFPIYKVDLQTLKIVTEYKAPGQSTYGIWVNEQANYLVSNGTGNFLNVWDLTTGQYLHGLSFNPKSIFLGRTFGFLTDEHFYAFAGSTLHKFNLKTGILTVLPKPENKTSLADQSIFFGDTKRKQYVAYGRIYKQDTDEELKPINISIKIPERNNEGITKIVSYESFSFSSSQDSLFVCDTEGEVNLIIYDSVSKNYQYKPLIQKFIDKKTIPTETSNILMSKSGYLWGSKKHVLQTWRIDTLLLAKEYFIDNNPIDIQDFAIDGNKLYWGARSINNLYSMNLENFSADQVYSGLVGGVEKIGMSLDKKMISVNSHFNEWMIWDKNTGKKLWELGKIDSVYAHGQETYWDSTSCYSNAFGSCSFDKLNISNFRMQTPIPAMENECIYSIAVNKNILIGGGNSTIWKFDMLSQTFLNSIQIKKVGIITKVVFSPNRKKVAVCGREGLLLTNDSLNTVTYLKGHTDWINNICFSPDNRFLYSCSGSMFGNDKTIRKWDVATGKLLTTFESNENDIENIAISKDGLKIWSSGHEGNFRLWNTQTGKCLAIIWPIKTKDSINYCFFSPEGHYVGNEEYLKRFIISNTNKFPAFNLEASKAYFNSIR